MKSSYLSGCTSHSSFLPLKIHPATISSDWDLILYWMCWMDKIHSGNKLSVRLIRLWNQHYANGTHPNLCEQAVHYLMIKQLCKHQNTKSLRLPCAGSNPGLIITFFSALLCTVNMMLRAWWGGVQALFRNRHNLCVEICVSGTLIFFHRWAKRFTPAWVQNPIISLWPCGGHGPPPKGEMRSQLAYHAE